MTTRDFTANVISASKVVPDGNFKDSKASGIWDINEALDLIKGGNWPNAANINPAAFVDALFQTTVWDGSGSARSLTNDINLSGKGGLVWVKKRSGSAQHTLQDTVRGATKHIRSSGDSSESTEAQTITAFNSNGFSLGTDDLVNASSSEYVGWTFRKQPKFFDIVTYTGTSSNRTVSHNLGSVPGMIMIKCTSGSGNWRVYHRGVDVDNNDPEDFVLILNGTNEKNNSDSFFNDTAPTSTEFTVGGDDDVNDFGDSYVAYLFAHNDDDGGFGEPGDQDIIKCGDFTTDGSENATVTLGFEPQWVLWKETTRSTNWGLADTMRGMPVGGNDALIEVNGAGAETAGVPYITPTPTGFNVTNMGSSKHSIFMAIRRGGMQTPTAASSVFKTITRSGTGSSASITGVGFSPDLIITGARNASRTHGFFTRLHGANNYQISTGETGQYNNSSTLTSFDMDGYSVGSDSAATAINTSDTLVSWNFKRARNVYDAVIYTGTGSATTISHNLGSAPELILIKGRSTNYDRRWIVFTGTNNAYMRLNQTDGLITDGTTFNNTGPTSSVFTVGTDADTNTSGESYIAHLFTTTAGVSKVGSFTQSGATNVDCGFTGDTPSFILLKRTDSTGDWYVLDSERGINAGADPYSLLNSTAQETTNVDLIDPYSGGFATTSNLTNGDYIFLAIAATS